MGWSGAHVIVSSIAAATGAMAAMRSGNSHASR